MFGRRTAPDSSYALSQVTTRCPVRPDAVARGLAIRIVESSDDYSERSRLAQMLINELNATGELPACRVVVADRAQVHQHDGRRLQSKTYGYYRCRFAGGGVTDARIRIYHRTAVRQQVISAKVFLNTVIHEWMHHFDFAGLGLERSPHTAGFFARLRDLAESLEVGFVLPPDPEPSSLSTTTS